MADEAAIIRTPAEVAQEAWWRLKASKRTARAARSNNASKLGFPCERAQVLDRTIPDDQVPLPDVDLQCIFDEGNLHEGVVIRELQDAGLRITHTQVTFRDEPHDISGRLDGLLEAAGGVLPLEIKTCTRYTFERVRSWNDILNSSNVFIRNYAAQVTLYMYLTNCPRGLLCFKCKENGRLRFVDTKLDDGPTLELAETLLQRADRINGHLKAHTLPPHYEDPTLCAGCPRLAACQPPVVQFGDAMNLVADDQLEADVRRYMDLKPTAAEFEALKDHLKEILKAKQGMVGPYRITGKWIPVKASEPKPKAAYQYWKWNISDPNEKAVLP
jgi:hypothetical protein